MWGGRNWKEQRKIIIYWPLLKDMKNYTRYKHTVKNMFINTSAHSLFLSIDIHTNYELEAVIKTEGGLTRNNVICKRVRLFKESDSKLNYKLT